MAGNLSSDSAPIAQPQPQYPQPQYPQAERTRPYAAHAQPPQPPRPDADQPHARYPLGIDPEIWPHIRESAAQLSRIEDTFIRELHHDVMGLIQDPTGAPAQDIRVFCERMVHTLLWVALSDQSLGVIAETLRRVGAQNWLDGYPDSLYTNVAHGLVQTVHYLSENDWSASTGSAWLSYFMWARPHLIAGAQQAAAERTTAQQAVARHAAAQRATAEQEAARLDDEDEDNEDPGYGQIMLGMTRPRRAPRG